jgi:hypothetical protein
MQQRNVTKSRVFYTYVWGSHGDQGSPLTFTSKQNRTVAVRSTEEGDFVFGVVSRNPGDPDVQIPDTLKGRVINVWQISHGTADTAKFGIEARNSWDKLEDGSYRWPFALQPIRTWIIRDAPEFRELPGYTPATHTQRAITTVQEVGPELSATLMDLLVTNGEELEVMTPRFQTMASRVHQLRQKHPFALNGYHVQPDAGATNSIYITTLGKGGRVLKIGHAQDARQRVTEFNKFRLSSEKQWVLHTDQPIGSVRDAIEIEKYLGETFARYRTEPNNNEVFVDLDAMDVPLKLATARTTK